MHRLQENHFRGALVGPKGTGKTTLLLELQGKLEEMGFKTCRLFLNRDKRKLSKNEVRELKQAVNQGAIILLDGFEQMNLLNHAKFVQRVKHAKGLIVTVHKPIKLPTILRTATSFKTFKQMVSELQNDSRQFEADQLKALYDTHQGNIRLAFRSLYDLL